jgi:hypothetical protein
VAITAGDKGKAATGGVDPSILAALNAMTAGSGGTGSGRVYMGSPRVMTKTRPGAPEKGYRTQDIWESEETAAQEYYTWDPKKQSDFVAKGVLGGLLKLGDGPLEGATLWKKLVKEAAQYGAVGAKVQPLDIMAAYVQASGGGNAWRSAGVWQINTQTGERKYVGPGTYLGNGKSQQVDTRVDLTDPDTARAISTKLFQDLMGRDPGEGELSAFANALHSAEQNSPVVSSTTTQYDMDTGQPITSNTSQSGGVTADGKAYIQEQQVKKKKEYGAYQAATTYQNALESLVYGSPA